MSLNLNLDLKLCLMMMGISLSGPCIDSCAFVPCIERLTGHQHKACYIATENPQMANFCHRFHTLCTSANPGGISPFVRYVMVTHDAWIWIRAVAL